jgi:hypothetical protein
MTTDVSALVPLTTMPSGGKFLLAKTSTADPTRRDFALLEPSAVAAGGSGGSPPGGTAGQLQYNNGGVLGGFTASGDATIDPTTGTVVLANKGSANGPIMADFANKVPLAQLPVVTRTTPPPGTGTGITRFLREDLTWGVPPGSGGSGTSDIPVVTIDGATIPASVSQPYTIPSTTFRVLGASASPMFVILPSAPVLGVPYIVFSPMSGAATSAISVSPPAGGTINGGTVYQQTIDGEAVWYMALTATVWRLV